MRWLLLAATLVGGAGCLGVDSPDGSLHCADTDMYPGRACPEGFYCDTDSRCYRGSKTGPDMAKTGCAGLLSCELYCGTQTCNNGCLAAATGKAATLWNPVLSCALTQCGADALINCDASPSCRMCFESVLSAGLAGAGACWTQIGPCLAIGNQ